MMVTDYVGDGIIMLATFFVMFVIFSMYLIGHQQLKLVNNTFCLQYDIGNIRRQLYEKWQTIFEIV